MLVRLKELAAARESFAFETTLATRSYAPWLKQLQAVGYEVHLIFLWLPSADMAVARVADRVKAGGHDVPEAVIRRRFSSGLSNLRQVYIPLADSWKVIDNSRGTLAQVIASGVSRSEILDVFEPSAWQSIMRTEIP